MDKSYVGNDIIIETTNITRRFGDLVAVDNVTLAVTEGEIFGLVGPNGAGKSTMIKMLTTILPPSSGSASVAGYDVVKKSVYVRSLVGYVPQLISADGNITGYENLLIFAKLYGIPRAERDKRIHDSIDFMGLTDAADTVVKKYSGGMMRRLEIAQSMLHRPKVLFLDEPTIGLDPSARHAVWDHVNQLRNDFGATIFLTTHLMDEADYLCNRVGIMHHGKLVTVGTPSDLKLSVGKEGADLDDVFMYYAGDTMETGGSYREISRTRRTSRRLG